MAVDCVEKRAGRDNTISAISSQLVKRVRNELNSMELDSRPTKDQLMANPWPRIRLCVLCNGWNLNSAWLLGIFCQAAHWTHNTIRHNSPYQWDV